MPRRIAACVLALALALAAALPARAEFTGEVLMVPELTGWSLIEHEAGDRSGRRVLRRDRPNDDASMELLRLQSTDTEAEPATGPAVEALLAEARGDCAEVETQPPGLATVNGYPTTTLSLTCLRPTASETALPAKAAAVRIIMAKVIAGDFRLHQVVRIWEGQPKHGRSPMDSLELKLAWAQFFDAVELCSTLVEPCTPLARRAPGLDQRFVTMKARKKTSRPVIEGAVLLPQAKKFGRLTGQAEACGEDASPLLGNIERIFAEVADSERTAIAARSAFLDAREAAGTAHREQSLPCREILRVFHLYPTRLPRFVPYLESL